MLANANLTRHGHGWTELIKHVHPSPRSERVIVVGLKSGRSRVARLGVEDRSLSGRGPVRS
jgi:hypothetical protein